jgi:H/ACA ribonucleoprotein complex non-core subunit NAF1
MVEADSDAEADVAASAPMSAGTHAHLLSQLTSFVEGTSQHVNAADSDDEDFVLSEPLATEHEVPLPTVVAPPIERVPDTEKRVLAGAVMSWMPAKGVIEWINVQEAEEAEAREAEEVIAEVAGGVDSEESNMSADTLLDAQPEKQESSTTEAAASQATPAVLDVSTVSPSKVDKGKGKATSKFTSSGTVVIRAIHNPQASAGDGWLEEGSLLCWEDGRVLGTVR